VIRVKICGTMTVRDALMAVEYGADAVGFVMVDESPRAVSVETAADISRRLPPFVARVGVFVNAPADTVAGCLSEFLDYAQLHGDESPEECDRLASAVGGDRLVKAVRVATADDIAAVMDYTAVGAVLLDTRSDATARGGTGQTFDWSLALRAKAAGKPLILAGGLDPSNVADAVSTVRPYAVDAVTGIESRPGVKDAEKVRQFIVRAKTVAT